MKARPLEKLESEEKGVLKFFLFWFFYFFCFFLFLCFLVLIKIFSVDQNTQIAITSFFHIFCNVITAHKERMGGRK